MGLLKSILKDKNITKEQIKDRVLESASVIGLSMGPDYFSNDALEILNIIIDGMFYFEFSKNFPIQVIIKNILIKINNYFCFY